MRDGEEIGLFWVGLREIMEARKGVQVQLDGRNPERASRMGILLTAGQLRTNRQIFFNSELCSLHMAECLDY